MKKIHLLGFFAVGIAIVLGIMMALQTGEKSPILAKGSIALDPSLGDKAQNMRTLFLVVYDAESPMPMPYGAVKESLDQVPTSGKFFDFLITREKIQMMRPDAPLPHKMRLKVRLDLDGSAGLDQPGDLTGEVDGVTLGAQDINIVIDHLVPGH